MHDIPYLSNDFHSGSFISQLLDDKLRGRFRNNHCYWNTKFLGTVRCSQTSVTTRGTHKLGTTFTDRLRRERYTIITHSIKSYILFSLSHGWKGERSKVMSAWVLTHWFPNTTRS